MSEHVEKFCPLYLSTRLLADWCSIYCVRLSLSKGQGLFCEDQQIFSSILWIFTSLAKCHHLCQIDRVKDKCLYSENDPETKNKSIEFAVFDVKLFRIISAILPQLESLSLQKTSSSKGEMANALKSFSVCTQLRSLTIRDTTGRSSSLESMFAVRKFLASLFELEHITLMEINLLEVQYYHGGDAEGGGGGLKSRIHTTTYSRYPVG